MTHDTSTPAPVDRARPAAQAPTAGHRPGHVRMMLMMCLPMLALMAMLIVTGAWGWGSVLVTVGSMALMAVMMLVMARMGTGGHRR